MKRHLFLYATSLFVALCLGASLTPAQNQLEYLKNKPIQNNFSAHQTQVANPFGGVREITLTKPHPAHTAITAMGFDFVVGFTKARIFDGKGWKSGFKKGAEQALGAGIEQLGMNIVTQRGNFWGGKAIFDLGSSIKLNSRENKKLLCRFGTNYLVAYMSYDVCERKFDYYIRAGQVITVVLSVAQGDSFQSAESFGLGIPYFTTKRNQEGAAQMRLGTIVAQERWFNFPNPSIRSDIRSLFKQHESGHTFQYYRSQQCNDVIDGTFWKLFKKDYRKIPFRFGQDLCQIALSTGRENSPLELEIRSHDGVLEERIIRRVFGLSR